MGNVKKRLKGALCENSFCLAMESHYFLTTTIMSAHKGQVILVTFLVLLAVFFRKINKKSMPNIKPLFWAVKQFSAVVWPLGGAR